MIYVATSVFVALLTVELRTQDVTAWNAGLRDTPTCSDWLLTVLSSALSIKLRTGHINVANAKRNGMKLIKF